MAGTAVLRMETHQAISRGLLAHCAGRIRPKTAAKMTPEEAVISLVEPADLEHARDVAHRCSPRRGRRPNAMVDMVMAGPPAWDSPDAWPEDQVRAWAMASVVWARELAGPESVMLGAWLHRDETSPHVHVAIMPVTRGSETMPPKLGWNARLREAIQETDRPRAKTWYGAAQSWYAERMDEFELHRGREGSRATHARSDPAIAEQRRQAEAEAEQRRQAEAEEREAEREAEERRQAEAEERVALERAIGEVVELDAVAYGVATQFLTVGTPAVQDDLLAIVPVRDVDEYETREWPGATWLRIGQYGVLVPSARVADLRGGKDDFPKSRQAGPDVGNERGQLPSTPQVVPESQERRQEPQEADPIAAGETRSRTTPEPDELDATAMAVALRHVCLWTSATEREVSAIVPRHKMAAQERHQGWTWIGIGHYGVLVPTRRSTLLHGEGERGLAAAQQQPAPEVAPEAQERPKEGQGGAPVPVSAPSAAEEPGRSDKQWKRLVNARRTSMAQEFANATRTPVQLTPDAMRRISAETGTSVEDIKAAYARADLADRADRASERGNSR